MKSTIVGRYSSTLATRLGKSPCDKRLIQSFISCGGYAYLFLSLLFLSFPEDVYSDLVIAEPGWILTRTVTLPGAHAAHYNPLDGLLYAAQRFTGSSGIYRINDNGSTTQLTTANDHAAGIVIDPGDGDIFFSEDFTSGIFRIGFGQTGKTSWVSGFSAGDDDVAGMAIAPDNYTGGVIAAGQGLIVDRDNSNAHENIWRWSPDSPEGEVLVHSDNGTLVNPVDIAIGTNDIYVVDTGETEGGATPGAIYQVGIGGTLTLISTSESIIDPYGIAIDPITEDLLIADRGGDRIIRVNPATGAVSDFITDLGLDLNTTNGVNDTWAGIDITPEGDRLFVTAQGAGKVYTFTQIPEPSTCILFGMVALGVTLTKRKRSRNQRSE